MTAIADEQLADVPDADPPWEYGLHIYRGDSRSWAFRLWSDDERTVPYPLTGAVAAAQIRRTPDDRRAIDLVCQITLPNYVFCHLSAGQSAQTQTGRWDLQLSFPGSRVLTVIAGPVTVTPDVTR